MSKRNSKPVVFKSLHSDFDDIYRELTEIQERISLIMFDDKRGHWGTENELALTAAEADVASAMDQIAFLGRR